MGVIEAIRKGFGIATKNLSLVLILFGFNLIWNLASIPLAARPGTVPTPQVTVSALIFSALFILASIFIQGGSLGLVRDYIKEGRIKLGSFASYGLKYYFRLLGIGLIIVLGIGIVAIIATLLIASTAPLNNTAITIIASIIAITISVLGFYLMILTIMSPYSAIVDEIDIKRKIQFILSFIGSIILGVIASGIMQANTIIGVILFVISFAVYIYSIIIAFLDLKIVFVNSINLVRGNLYYLDQFKGFPKDILAGIVMIVILTLFASIFPTEAFPAAVGKATIIPIVAFLDFLLLLLGALLLGRVFVLLFTLVHLSIIIGLCIGFLAGLVTVAMPVGVGQVIIGIVNSIFNGYLGVVMMATFLAFYLALAGKEKSPAPTAA